MATMLLGKKVGMTQVYDESGRITPVTVIQAGPCSVTQVKTVETDGYNALQLGFEDVRKSRATKPMLGHVAKASVAPKRFVREVRTDEAGNHTPGDTLTVDVFDEIAYVDVIGMTKGRGFQGGMKRHNFKGQLASHGVERKHRSPGSIAVVSGNTGRSIKKGKRMAGHMGDDRCTVKNLKVIRVDTEHNLIVVKGSVPGARNQCVMVCDAKTKR